MDTEYHQTGMGHEVKKVHSQNENNYHMPTGNVNITNSNSHDYQAFPMMSSSDNQQNFYHTCNI